VRPCAQRGEAERAALLDHCGVGEQPRRQLELEGEKLDLVVGVLLHGPLHARGGAPLRVAHQLEVHAVLELPLIQLAVRVAQPEPLRERLKILMREDHRLYQPKDAVVVLQPFRHLLC